MDDKERIAEMEELIRRVPKMPDGWIEPSWYARRDAILASPPDPDAGAKEVFDIFQRHGSWSTFDTQVSGMKNGMRAVAAWSDARVKAARIAGMREALETPGSIADLIAKAETAP